MKHPLGLDDNDSDEDDENTGPVLPVSKSSKVAHQKKDKLFSSSSSSSEFDSDNSNTPLNLKGNRPKKILADKAIAPEVSTPAVKNLLGDSPALRTDTAVISNPPLVSIGIGALDNADSDSSSSEHSDVLLATGTKSVLPNIVHNDTADITSFAYDETLLVENNKVRHVCISVFVLMLSKINGLLPCCFNYIPLY